MSAPVWVTRTAGIGNISESKFFSYKFIAVHNTLPVTYTINSGSQTPPIPDGLSLNRSTGVLSGVPYNINAEEVYTFVVKATAGAEFSLFTFIINSLVKPVWITTNKDIGTIAESKTYSYQLEATFGAESITYEIISGVAPPGITLSTAGLLSGTPTIPNTIEYLYQSEYPFSVRATVSSGPMSGVHSDYGFQINVLPFVLPEIVPDGPTYDASSLSTVIDGQYYEVDLDLTDTSIAPLWGVVGGSLPPRLSLDPVTGLISGYIYPETLTETPLFDGDYDMAEYDMPLYDQLDGISSQTALVPYNFQIEALLTLAGIRDTESYHLDVISRGKLLGSIEFFTADTTVLTADMDNHYAPIIETRTTPAAIRNGSYFLFNIDGVDLEADAFTYQVTNYKMTLEAGHGAFSDNRFLDGDLINEERYGGGAAGSVTLAADPVFDGERYSFTITAAADTFLVGSYLYVGTDLISATKKGRVTRVEFPSPTTIKVTYRLWHNYIYVGANYAAATKTGQIVAVDHANHTIDYYLLSINNFADSDVIKEYASATRLDTVATGTVAALGILSPVPLSPPILPAAAAPVPFNDETGVFSGIIDETFTESEKEFPVRIVAYKLRGGYYYRSDPVTYIITVLNTVDRTVTWETPTTLGTLYNGDLSELFVTATTDLATLPANPVYRYEAVNPAALPPGLAVLPSGLISGRVTFNSAPSYTFNVKFSILDADLSYAEERSSIKTFTVNVNKKYVVPATTTGKPYENIYLKAQLDADTQSSLNTILGDENFFPAASIYRSEDSYFGKARDLRFLFVPGLEPASIQTYLDNVTNENHYVKLLAIGEVKTAVAKDENFNVKYEVVYIQIHDPMPLTQNKTITSTNPYYAGPLVNSPTYRDSKPNSLYLMRQKLIGENEVNYFNKGALPDWMTSTQEDGSVLGLISAIVLCYTVPGAAKTIAFRLKAENVRFENVKFAVDRYNLDNFLSTNYNIGTPGWSGVDNFGTANENDKYITFQNKNTFV